MSSNSGPENGFDAGILKEIKNAKIKNVLSRALVTQSSGQDKEKIGEKLSQTTASSSIEANDLAKEFKDLIAKLIHRGKEKLRDRLRASILRAESSGQKEELSKLMSEYQQLIKSM